MFIPAVHITIKFGIYLLELLSSRSILTGVNGVELTNVDSTTHFLKHNGLLVLKQHVPHIRNTD